MNIVPRDVAGRPTQLTARLLARLPVAMGDRVGVWLRTLTVGDLGAYGIRTPDLPPAAQLRIHGKTPVIDIGTVAAIKAGRIGVRPGIERMEGTTVWFTDGDSADVETIILATGYRPQLEDLLDTADGLVDGDGAPRDCIGAGRYAGLYFVGFDNHKTGGILGTIGEESDRVVSHIVASR